MGDGQTLRTASLRVPRFHADILHRRIESMAPTHVKLDAKH